MLIHWYTYVNNLSLPLVLEFAVYFNKMKDWGHMKFENESEIACWHSYFHISYVLNVSTYLK